MVLLEPEGRTHFTPEVKRLHGRMGKSDGHGGGDIFGAHFLGGFWLEARFDKGVGLCPEFGVMQG